MSVVEIGLGIPIPIYRKFAVNVCVCVCHQSTRQPINWLTYGLIWVDFRDNRFQRLGIVVPLSQKPADKWTLKVENF